MTAEPTPLRRLSVPPRVRTTPRPLAAAEIAAFTAIADVLVPGTERDPAPSASAGWDDALLRSLAARADVFEQLLVVATGLAGSSAETIEAELRRLHAEDPDTFNPLSAVLAGAYFQLPVTLERLRYPGQKRNPPRLEEAVDQIMSGILDPVIARGQTYVPDGTEDA